MATFNLPFLSLPVGTAKSVALDVFIKMNTTSIHLTPFDILVAEMEEETGESFHDLVAKLREQVSEIDSYIDPRDLILDVGALREDRSPTQANYFRIDLERLVTEWQTLLDGVTWTVSFLEEERVFDAERLPTVAVLRVLCALYEHIPPALDELGNARVLLRKYVWRAFLTNRYEQTAATRSLQDFRALRDVLTGTGSDNAVPIFDEVAHPLPTKDDLKRLGWPKSKDIRGRGLLAVALRAGGFDLADGAPASRSHLRIREYHHLFPEVLLTREAGLTQREASPALNCALITWNTNRNISAKEPMLYLEERALRGSLGREELERRLISHVVPYAELAVGGYETLDPSLRSTRILEDFETFLASRATLFMEPISALCSGRTWPS
jgi:hypothetical protein